MNIFDKLLFNIKLIGIWFKRILFCKSYMKTNIFKKIFYAFHGFKEDQVVLYNLNLKNYKNYLSEFDWYKSRRINGKYSFLLNNKVVSTDMLKQYIKVPNIYYIKKDNTLDYNEIINTIKTKKSVFLKPIGKGAGVGVRRIESKKDKLYMDDIEITSEELTNYLIKHNNYFITETIKQGDFASSLYDKTSNTIRMIALRDNKTQQFKIYFAVQRIGTHDTIPVDNGSRGGLVSKIDLKTGKLSVAKSLHNTNSYKIHPDSKTVIEGAIVPNFKEIQEQILELSNKFAYFNFIAWDILLTNNGIVIIEANTSSGVNIMQVFGGLRNSELGNFYRYHKIIK